MSPILQYNTVHTVLCIVYSAYCIVYIVYCILYSVLEAIKQKSTQRIISCILLYWVLYYTSLLGTILYFFLGTILYFFTGYYTILLYWILYFFTGYYTILLYWAHCIRCSDTTGSYSCTIVSNCNTFRNNFSTEQCYCGLFHRLV